jgi:hypothetical protein
MVNVETSEVEPYPQGWWQQVAQVHLHFSACNSATAAQQQTAVKQAVQARPGAEQHDGVVYT